MSVNIDFTGSTNQIIEGLKQTRAEMAGVADGYEEIEAKSKKAFSGASTSTDKTTESLKKKHKVQVEEISIISKIFQAIL